MAFADRDGRCVVMPCKVGDVLFYEDDCGTDEETVNKIVVDIETDGGIYKPSDIGKTVFLTREEAEQEQKNGTDKPENKHFLQRFMEVK